MIFDVKKHFAGAGTQPSDAVILVFRQGCVVKKLFVAASSGKVPLDQVVDVGGLLAGRIRAWGRRVKVGAALDTLDRKCCDRFRCEFEILALGVCWKRTLDIGHWKIAIRH